MHLTPDVLIISKRPVPRLADLSADEVSDLFRSVQRVGSVVEKAYSAEALNIAVQVGQAGPPTTDDRTASLQDNRCLMSMYT